MQVIGVIDFNRWEVGDPYEEFYKLESFGIEESIPYCVGQIDEYFMIPFHLTFEKRLRRLYQSGTIKRYD